MQPEEPGGTRKTVIAALAVFLGFAALAALMPRIMLLLGESSLLAAGLVAALFLLLPFAVLAWRARVQRRKD